MSAAAIRAKRRRRAGGSARRPHWWGEGPPPDERWPGTTIKIPATWSTLRSRWESPDGLYFFDHEVADIRCEFFPTYLRHFKGELAEQPFELLAYQSMLIVRPFFGWKKTADGLRRFRKVFAALPKGNGKSPLCSGIAIVMLLCDGEPGAEVYGAAADKDQGRIVFGTSQVMIERSADVDGDGVPDLLAMCEVYKSSIFVPTTESVYRVLSADVSTKHGLNTHCLIFDELHTQRSRDFFEALQRGIVKRRQPALFMITTAGDDDESICFEEWEYGREVQKGTVPDATYLPVIFEAAAEEDWRDEKVWRRLNPGIGITVNEEALRAEAVAAQAQPRKLNDFLRYHLNRWTNRAEAWFPVEWWDACPGDLEDEDLVELDCAAGLDMAQKIDLVAFVLGFKVPLPGAAPSVEVQRETEEEEIETVEVSLNFRLPLRAWFWLPEETAREQAKQGLPYLEWAAQGFLTLTDGALIDYDRVYRDIVQKILPRFPRLKMGQVGFDPAFATDIANRLRDKAGLQTVEILQNYRHLSEPCQILEGLVKARRVVRDRNPVLRWCFENCTIKQDDAGRIRLVKPRRGRSRRRIDGAVASAMAVSRLVLSSQPKPQKPRITVFGGQTSMEGEWGEGPEA